MQTVSVQTVFGGCSELQYLDHNDWCTPNSMLSGHLFDLNNVNAKHQWENIGNDSDRNGVVKLY